MAGKEEDKRKRQKKKTKGGGVLMRTDQDAHICGLKPGSSAQYVLHRERQMGEEARAEPCAIIHALAANKSSTYVLYVLETYAVEGSS